MGKFMQRKSYLLILTVILLSFGSSACLPFWLLQSEPTAKKNEKKSNRKSSSKSKSENHRTGNSSPKTFDVDKNANYINVMGKEMPEMPDFDELSAEPGKVRGYVKDWKGNPLAGAQFGVRSTATGGFYSGSQGESDADGFYQFEVPAGVAHFYNAGYAVEWGDDGLAAIGLHPADGKLDSFASTTGGVENFVLLPYGVTSRENTQQNPHLASTYYGGSIYIHYYAAEAGNDYPMQGSVIEGSVIEISLTPEGEMYAGNDVPESFTIRKTVGFAGGFYIHNLPLGNYRMSVKTADGEPLKMELNKPRNSEFGMKPEETSDSAVVTFAPGDARANMVTPQYGGWSTIGINLKKP
jgi:hypothetical protein